MRIESGAGWVSYLCARMLLASLLMGGFVQAEATGTVASKDGDGMDREAVRQSVVSTVRLLNDVYVYPGTGRRAGVEMIKRLDAGEYDWISSRQQFADRIGSDLAEFSGDGHMGVIVAVADEAPTHVLTESVDRFRFNHAFEKLEILQGNIGYLKLNKFFQDEAARATADHAMGFLSATDALILDLTECKGGSPELVRHLLSYFFSERTLLWSIFDRNGVSVHDAYVRRGLGAARFKRDFPVIILTGPNTASAAELFTYTLTSFGKARTVGQGSNGIAHMVGAVAINQYFVGRFSMYRMVNPVTHSDWEGTGLTPDIHAAPGDSLAVAVAIAAAAIEKGQRVEPLR
jgi:retinol-binding protein 3